MGIFNKKKKIDTQLSHIIDKEKEAEYYKNMDPTKGKRILVFMAIIAGIFFIKNLINYVYLHSAEEEVKVESIPISEPKQDENIRNVAFRDKMNQLDSLEQYMIDSMGCDCKEIINK